MTSTVAAVTDAGPRDVNEDRYFTACCPDDGSWVIAVADGLGGHPRGAEAAEAAIAAVPSRIETPEAMHQAFVAAAARVEKLAPPWEDFLAAKRTECGSDEEYERRSASRYAFESWVFQHLGSCPLSTLCVAAWTPAGGVLVGSMGDTLAVEVRWPAAGSPYRRLVADPHRYPRGGISSCLGYTRPDPPDLGADRHRNPNFACVSIDPHPDPTAETAIIIASDGVWEPLWNGLDIDRDDDIADSLYGHYTGRNHSSVALYVAHVAAAPAPADTLASRVLRAATEVGLDDNATVAAAHMAPGVSGASR